MKLTFKYVTATDPTELASVDSGFCTTIVFTCDLV